MRFLCSCSAAAVLLVGCGSKSARAPDPFAYDTSRPLAVRDAGVALSGPKVAVHVVTFLGAARPVNAFLAVPRSKGRHPAVLFLHGSGGSREDLLLPAIELATRGAVTMTISQPNETQTFRPLVVNAHRALDVLAARRDVDPERLGLVGFSLGGQTAAILAGDEPRLKSVGILAGRGGPVPVHWLRQSAAKLFLQAGRSVVQVGRRQLEALIAAAPGQPRVRWYAAGHGLNRRAFEDQVDWQAHQLGLR
jgi:dienelactone hydrolase